MFIYALAKGANSGYLPKEFKLKAQESFQGLMKNLVTVDSVGVIHLNNVCKVSGLGGKPYRDGSFEYYISEPKRTDDFKGYGPFLLAAIELEKKEKRKIVGLDYYYNNEYTIVKDTVKKRAHYVWEDTTNGGFSGLATIIDRLGADLDTLQSPPTLESLNRFSVYIIVDPDTPKETQELHYIQPEQSAIIEQWVKEGGTLVLMGNDSGNAEFKHLNELAGRFGIHFNEDSHHPVKGKNYETGRCTNLPNHPIFDRVKSIFIKELSSLKLTPPAKEILVEKGITIIAESRIGKGLVLAIGDPWFYNEYLDNRRLPVGFENYDAAVSVFRWLLTNAKNIR
jgi:unsaturated rhamnogalacturonyl hydrolase